MAPDIAGQNIANPTALMLTAALMLDHLGMKEKGDRLRTALRTVIEKGVNLTPDLGGTGGTDSFTDAIINELQ